MAYVLEILNTSGVKVAQLTERDCTVTVDREINGQWTITIFYPYPVLNEDKSSHLFAYKYRAKVYNTKDGTYNIFLLDKPTKVKDSNGNLYIEVMGTHKVIDDLNKVIVTDDLIYVNSTPAVILTKILSYVSDWSVGTVEPTAEISLTLSWETALSALQKLLVACGGEYDADEINGEIDLLSQLGSDNGVQIRPEKNLESIENTRYSKDIINKVYGVGGGQPPITIAGTRHVVNGYNDLSGALTIEGNKFVVENDSWNTNYSVYFVTGAEAGNYYTITDCTAGTEYDTVTITTGLNIVAGDKFVLCDSTEDHYEIDFIRAGTSIATYGQIEGVIKNQRISDVINLIETPALDGVYTSGLCEDWTKSGTPTVTENTVATFIQYGAKSQEVAGAADDAGIYQIVPVTTGRYYTIDAWLYIVSGMIQMEITDGTSTWNISKSLAVPGWQKFHLQEKIAGVTLTVRLYQDGAGYSDFYIDAVQVTEGVMNYSFSSNCDRKELWDSVYDFIIKRKDPDVEYVAAMIDLYKINPVLYKQDEINLGDTVHIFDNDLEIDNLSARIKKINLDIFRPELTKHVISTEA